MTISKKTKKIFVVGNSRSGTTIMARLLGKSRFVHTFHEIHFFEMLWNPDARLTILDKEDAEVLLSSLLSIERDDFYGKRDIDKYLQEARVFLSTLKDDITAPMLFEKFLAYETEKNAKRIACEQTPRNVFYIREILNYYTDAVIINMVRDPRSVLLSQKNKWRIRSLGASNFPISEVVRSWFNYHPVTTSLLWNSSINAARTFEKNPRVLTVKFEDFVSHPESVVRRVCSFVGVEFESCMLDIPRIEGGTSSFYRIDQLQGVGIDKAAADRWTRGGLNAGELFLCQKITKKNMDYFGYEATGLNLPLSWLRAILYVATMPLQLINSIILNFHRHRNLLSAIKRRLLD